ncbi:hypothetical protein ABIC32_001478 [Brevundimonas sp. 1080]|uniref:hypothetical protein n=1 Tax=Brevundimonas sp. 1080 TaxID=3156405 RepID=UPI003398E937
MPNHDPSLFARNSGLGSLSGNRLLGVGGFSAVNGLLGGLESSAFPPPAPEPSLAAILAALAPAPPPINHADRYLRAILQREAVDTSPSSPLRLVQKTLWPIIWAWANGHLLSVTPSGSFAKGTANRSGTDIDLFISVSPDIGETLRQVYDKLERALQNAGYVTRRQNVSINITVGGQSVDLVPAKRQNLFMEDHSLYRRKADSWTKTNVATHAQLVSTSGRTEEIRILKLWRDQLGLDWSSFYLELTVLRALSYGSAYGDLAANVSRVFDFLRDNFVDARIVDPANTNNLVSDDLTQAGKQRVSTAGGRARAIQYWRDIVR